LHSGQIFADALYSYWHFGQKGIEHNLPCNSYAEHRTISATAVDVKAIKNNQKQFDFGRFGW
jgi:hypothetical protein